MALQQSEDWEEGITDVWIQFAEECLIEQGVMIIQQHAASTQTENKI